MNLCTLRRLQLANEHLHAHTTKRRLFSCHFHTFNWIKRREDNEFQFCFIHTHTTRIICVCDITVCIVLVAVFALVPIRSDDKSIVAQFTRDDTTHRTLANTYTSLYGFILRWWMCEFRVGKCEYVCTGWGVFLTRRHHNGVVSTCSWGVAE